MVPLGSWHLLPEQAHGRGASHADGTGAPGALRDTGTLTLPCGKRTSVPTPTPCPSFPVCKVQYKALSPSRKEMEVCVWEQGGGDKRSCRQSKGQNRF